MMGWIVFRIGRNRWLLLAENIYEAFDKRQVADGNSGLGGGGNRDHGGAKCAPFAAGGRAKWRKQRFQATEKPALQYALLPKVEETEKGNAAVKYADAATQMPQLSDEESTLLSYVGNAPLEQLHADDPSFKAILAKFDTATRLSAGALESMMKPTCLAAMRSAR